MQKGLKALIVLIILIILTGCAEVSTEVETPAADLTTQATTQDH